MPDSGRPSPRACPPPAGWSPTRGPARRAAHGGRCRGRAAGRRCSARGRGARPAPGPPVSTTGPGRPRAPSGKRNARSPSGHEADLLALGPAGHRAAPAPAPPPAPPACATSPAGTPRATRRPAARGTGSTTGPCRGRRRVATRPCRPGRAPCARSDRWRPGRSPAGRPDAAARESGRCCCRPGRDWACVPRRTRDERLDDPRPEAIRHVVHPVPHLETGRERPGLLDGVEAAAGLLGRVVVLRVAEVLEGDRLHVAAELAQGGQADGAVDAAADRQQDGGAGRDGPAQVVVDGTSGKGMALRRTSSPTRLAALAAPRRLGLHEILDDLDVVPRPIADVALGVVLDGQLELGDGLAVDRCVAKRMARL